METRRASLDDASKVHELLATAFASFRTHYTAACFDATVLDEPRIQARMREGPVFVAEIDGEMVGTVSCKPSGETVYVRGMAVDPKARRLGVGRALLGAAKDYAMDAGAASLWLSTTPFLTGSIALYEAFGFTPCKGPADLHGTPLQSYKLALPKT